MKLLKITPKVHNYYQKRVNGNSEASVSLTRRKLTRNVKLAIKSPLPFQDCENLTLYHYGNLDIVVNHKTHRIVSIRNYKGASVNWFAKDMEKYNALNKKYGINVLEDMDDIAQ